MAAWIRVTILMLAVSVLGGCATTSATATRELYSTRALADQAYVRQDCETAIPLYRELADSLKENAEVLLKMGNCLVRQQRWEQAMDAYREALKTDPSYMKAWYNLSYVQAQDLARTVAEMSANVDPTDPAAERVRILADKILEAFQAVQQQDAKPSISAPEEDKSGETPEQ